MTRYLLFCSAIVVWVSSLLYMPQAKADSIGMVTGSTTGTYFQFGHDIAKLPLTAGLEIRVKELEESIFQACGTNSKPTSLPAQWEAFYTDCRAQGHP
jgi:TRAP-type uncharacterized transport system substrate-binding protein